MDDLVDRLRAFTVIGQSKDGHQIGYESPAIQHEAAARIQALETSLTEARRQALEEAAKIADTAMRREVTGLKLDSSYRAGIRWAGERIKDAIRALASDEVKP